MDATQPEPFVEVGTRDNFYQTCAFIPMSFALVTTVHDSGETGIGPHALCYPFGISRPWSMLLISRGNSATAANIRRTGKCALNYLQFDREQLAAISRLGLPGQALADKQRDMPFTLLPSPEQARAENGQAPRIIGEAFQVFQCTWDRSYDLDRAPQNATEVGASRFVLQIDHIWLSPRYRASLESGSDFPSMPIFYGFRSQGDFWFAEHESPFSVPLPKVEGLETQSIFYLANRLDGTVRFTREACAELAAVPKPFVRNALLGIIAAAKASGVSEVDVAFMKNARRDRTR